jgi:SnoaL-like protein
MGDGMSDPVRHLVEKDRIIDTINQLFIATDNRDWATVRGCLADTVFLDMTSLAGGRPSSMTAEQVAAGWEQGLRSIEAVHHQAGNYRVDVEGREATAFCYGTASHYRKTRSGRNTRVFVGSYDFHLQLTEGRWQIDSFRFNFKYVEGNAELDRGD